MSSGSRNVFIFAAAIALGYGIWSLMPAPVQDYSKPDTATEKFTVRSNVNIEFIVQNKTQRELKNAELRFALPVGRMPTQHVSTVTASKDVQILSDFNGNQVAYFQFEALVPRDTRSIKISVDLRLPEKDSTATSPIDDVIAENDDLQRFLVDDPLLDISHARINALVQQLQAEKVETTVDNLLGWLNQNRQKGVEQKGAASAVVNPVVSEIEQIPLTNITEDLPVSEILERGVYPEVDAAYVLVALTRAMKIPSRITVGLNTDGRTKGVYTFDDLVLFTEIYSANRWQTVDLNNFRLINSHESVILRTLDVMPARQVMMQPYRLLVESVGVEFVAGSEKYRFSPG